MMLTWPDIWPNANLVWSLIWGVGYFWPKGSLLTVILHLVIRCLYWGYIWSMWPKSLHTWPQDVSAWGRVRLTFCSISSQPASQLASCNWTANQPCDKISTCQTLGWSDGGRRTGSLTTFSPSPGSQHSHWFPLGNDLPDQGKASDTNELCSLLYTIGTTFRDHLQFCIYIT